MSMIKIHESGPATLRRGLITKTCRIAAAHVAAKPQIDLRKLAQQYRAKADGFDRRAGFLREDGDEAGAVEATEEATRLRTEAQKLTKQDQPPTMEISTL
jgi:hypothetical protein